MHLIRTLRGVVLAIVTATWALSPSLAAAQQMPTITGALEGEVGVLTGAGGTFPARLYQKWFDEYAKTTRVTINYQAIGSGGGIKAIQDMTTPELTRRSETFIRQIAVDGKPIFAEPWILLHSGSGERCAPPPPVAAPFASSLRAPSRGDHPA